MIIIEIVTVIGIIAAMAFIVTQLIIPAMTNRSLFPLFNRKKQQAIAETSKLNDQSDTEELLANIEQFKQQLKEDMGLSDSTVNEIEHLDIKRKYRD